MNWQPMANRLTHRLLAEGSLSPEWRGAFTSVPRHKFVPSFYAHDNEEVDASDVDRWLVRVYSDDSLTTQLRAAPGTETLLPSSSSSQPSVMARMLTLLEVRAGNRILEIGTGTGYNAALLSYRLGSDHVFSIDIDPALVDAAADRLAAVGFHPTLRPGDGFGGMPDKAPFDAIIATCAVRDVPPAWIQQLKPGGRIVAPVGGDGCGLLDLTKVGEKEVTGRFDAHEFAFMPLREEVSTPLAPGRTLVSKSVGIGQWGVTALDPNVVSEESRDFRLFLQFHIPGMTIGTGEGQHGPNLTLFTADSRAEVRLDATEEGFWPVLQHGARLWDTVQHVYAEWARLGKPARTRFGVSAMDDLTRQYVWLDDEDSPYAWQMPI